MALFNSSDLLRILSGYADKTDPEQLRNIIEYEIFTSYILDSNFPYFFVGKATSSIIKMIEAAIASIANIKDTISSGEIKDLLLNQAIDTIYRLEEYGFLDNSVKATLKQLANDLDNYSGTRISIQSMLSLLKNYISFLIEIYNPIISRLKDSSQFSCLKPSNDVIKHIALLLEEAINRVSSKEDAQKVIALIKLLLSIDDVDPAGSISISGTPYDTNDIALNAKTTMPRFAKTPDKNDGSFVVSKTGSDDITITLSKENITETLTCSVYTNNGAWTDGTDSYNYTKTTPAYSVYSSTDSNAPKGTWTLDITYFDWNGKTSAITITATIDDNTSWEDACKILNDALYNANADYVIISYDSDGTNNYLYVINTAIFSNGEISVIGSVDDNGTVTDLSFTPTKCIIANDLVVEGRKLECGNLVQFIKTITHDPYIKSQINSPASPASFTADVAYGSIYFTNIRALPFCTYDGTNFYRTLSPEFSIAGTTYTINLKSGDLIPFLEYENFSDVTYSNNEYTISSAASISIEKIKAVDVSSWLAGWQYAIKITVDHTKIDADLTDFPMLVKLNSDNFDFSKANSDGSDIRFTDSDGVTLLPYEIEAYDSTNQKAEVWVKIPSISSTADTEFYLYFGNPSASDIQSSDVWDNNYAAVWHMESSNGTAKDSTVNGNDGTVNGGVTEVDGITGKALDLDGSSGYISVPSNSSLDITDTLSLEVWVKIEGGYRILTKQYDSNGNLPYHIDSANSHFRFLTYESGTQHYVSSEIAPTGSWQYIVATYDKSLSSDNMKIYVDGLFEASSTYTDGLSTNALELWMGRYSTGYLKGTIDEVRISNIARSDAYISATHTAIVNTLLSFSNYTIPTTISDFIVGNSKIQGSLQSYIDLSNRFNENINLQAMGLKASIYKDVDGTEYLLIEGDPLKVGITLSLTLTDNCGGVSYNKSYSIDGKTNIYQIADTDDPRIYGFAENSSISINDTSGEITKIKDGAYLYTNIVTTSTDTVTIIIENQHKSLYQTLQTNVNSIDETLLIDTMNILSAFNRGEDIVSRLDSLSSSLQSVVDSMDFKYMGPSYEWLLERILSYKFFNLYVALTTFDLCKLSDDSTWSQDIV